MRAAIRCVLASCWLVCFTAEAAQLPPEILVDRYLIQAERLMNEHDYKAALEAMDKILALQKEHDLALPDEFDFKYARVLLSAGSVQSAIDTVSRYLVTAGKTGESYRQALELLDEAEQRQSEKEKAQATADEKLAEAERLIDRKHYSAARDLVNNLIELRREYDLTLRGEFHFVYARSALSAGMITAAMDSANKYLSRAGTSGKYYQETQLLLEEASAKMPIRPEMVVVPGGSFRMGCVSGVDCHISEFPVHDVTIESFELSKFEVTFEEYERFVAATGHRSPEDEGWGRGRRPVINVSWEDAVAYVEWLSAQTGERYRLPTEAEWEYAARAGSQTRFHCGNDPSQLCRYANHATGSKKDFLGNNEACADGVDKGTATVGSYLPNAFGLYDMHGNVEEWVQDCSGGDGSYRGAPVDGSAWLTGRCNWRRYRGGSWGTALKFLQVSTRNSSPLDAWSAGGRSGFRLARTITP